MALHLQLAAPPTVLPAHCTPTTPFLFDVSTYFHVCIPTPLAFLSTTLGVLSIISWLFAQLPQIYKNYQLQSTAGLSLFFLVEWCAGDSTNLLGALFTYQATWQVTIATYYVFVDVCLVCQYFWYTYFKPRIVGGSLHSSGSSILDDNDSDIINSLSPINTNFNPAFPNPQKADSGSLPPSGPKDAPHFSSISYEKDASSPSRPVLVPTLGNRSSTWNPGPSPRTVLYIATLCALMSTAVAAPSSSTVSETAFTWFYADSTKEIAGTILSWCSTFLYLGSRIPQLYKNWNRKSTAGLSPLLFIAAFCGNLFYSTSLVTNPNGWNNFGPYGGHGWAGPTGSKRLDWIARAAPFCLGAAGVLVMDAAMGLQFFLYGEGGEEKIVKVRDSTGRSRWHRVDGWMRGWIPSVAGKERVVGLEESQRLLSESRELERGEYGTL